MYPISWDNFSQNGMQTVCVPLSEIKKYYFAALVPYQNPIFSKFHLATIEPKERNRKSASLLHRSVFRASHQKWGRWDAYDTRVILLSAQIDEVFPIVLDCEYILHAYIPHPHENVVGRPFEDEINVVVVIARVKVSVSYPRIPGLSLEICANAMRTQTKATYVLRGMQ